MIQLSGKTIWLTGASSGIGEALAHRLGRIDCRLALSARSAAPLEAVAEQINRLGGSAAVFPSDVTNETSVLSAAAAIERQLGPVDILITCQGDYAPMSVADFDVAHVNRLMDVNYCGTVRCVGAVLGGMIARRRGHIAVVSSIVGYRGLPNSASYGATKAALINFAESLRFDLTRHDVGVTVINPGFVRTRLTDKNDFPMPFRIEPGEAAERIVAGLRGGRKEIHFPWQFTWGMKAMRILPYPLYDYLITRYVAR